MLAQEVDGALSKELESLGLKFLKVAIRQVAVDVSVDVLAGWLSASEPSAVKAPLLQLVPEETKSDHADDVVHLPFLGRPDEKAIDLVRVSRQGYFFG